MRYQFRMVPPGEGVKIRILESDSEGPLPAATFGGRRRDLTTRNILAAFLALPLTTLKVVGGIRYEALRLWLKRAPYYPHGSATARTDKSNLAAGALSDLPG
jgi:DUF1365 family protein